MFGLQRKSGCQRIRTMLSPYIDNRLDSVERDEVKYHVEACEACRHKLESLESTVQLLRSVPAVTAPRSFTLAEAHRRPVHIHFGNPFNNWLPEMAFPIVPNVNQLRIVAAAAVILLAVVVAGDLSGTFYTEISSDVEEPAAVAEVIDPTSPIGTQPMNPPNEALGPEVPDTPSQDENKFEIGDIIPEAKPADPSNDLPEKTGVANPVEGIEYGAGERVPPTPPPDAPLPAETDIPERATLVTPEDEAHIAIPGEVTNVLQRTNASVKVAYSWLRPLEIALAALAIILGGTGILVRRKNRGSST